MTMPLKKIGEPISGCKSPQHDPPRHLILVPGIYRHQCPKCGTIVRFSTNGVRVK